MKRMYILFAALVACAVVAYAGQVADRASVTTGTSTGSATWTNSGYNYSVINLKRITVKGGLAAINTVTVTRVTTDGLWTNTCGSVVLADSVGTQTTLAYNYLLAGDKLVFSSHVSTGCVALIEYEVQQH